MRILIAVVSLVYALIARAEESFLFANIKNDNASAVLVLAPGMNTNGAFFLKESSWREFAKRNNLGIIALNYSSSKKIYIIIAKDIITPTKVRGKRCSTKSSAFTERIYRLFSTDFRVERNLSADLLTGVRIGLSLGAHIRRNFGIIRKTVAK